MQSRDETYTSSTGKKRIPTLTGPAFTPVPALKPVRTLFPSTTIRKPTQIPELGQTSSRAPLSSTRLDRTAELRDALNGVLAGRTVTPVSTYVEQEKLATQPVKNPTTPATPQVPVVTAPKTYPTTGTIPDEVLNSPEGYTYRDAIKSGLVTPEQAWEVWMRMKQATGAWAGMAGSRNQAMVDPLTGQVTPVAYHGKNITFTPVWFNQDYVTPEDNARLKQANGMARPIYPGGPTPYYVAATGVNTEPITELPPVDMGGGGGGGITVAEPIPPSEPAGPGKPNWSETYHIPGAPDWWRGIVADQTTPELEYAMLLNSMIPFMSAEDQRAIATNLAIQFPDAFGMYNAVSGQYSAPTTEFGLTGRRSNTETNGILYQGQPFGAQFGANTYSKERANSILSALETVKSKMKIPEGGLGPGYTYLQQVASALRDFGGPSGATRQQYTQLMSALDPLTAATKAENLAAYGPASRMLTQPFFSAGSVLPVTKLDNGEYIFGSPNAALF